MNLFIDNDVLEKLASWDILEEGIQACQFPCDAVRVLPTLKFRLGLAGHKNQKRRNKHPQDVLTRIKSFLAKTSECIDAPPTMLDALVDVANLDAGEALLFAQAAEVEGALLATGDKRSIEAVATAPGCAELAKKLTNRVLCLEQILLKTIGSLGFEVVKDRVVSSSALELDTAVHAAFGSKMLAEEHVSCGGLERRVQTLTNATGCLLVPYTSRFLDDSNASG